MLTCSITIPNLQEKTWDVAVIGSGVFGAWTAYRTAQTGRSVVLVDALGVADPRSSSGAESRIIRAGYGSNEVYTRFAVESLAAWKKLFGDIRKPLFHPTGVLWFADPRNDRFAATRESMSRAGVRFENFDDAAIRRRYPQFHFAGEVAGMLEPNGGVLLADTGVKAVVEAARRIGVEFLQEPVQAPITDGEISTASGTRLSAGTFVFACGAWLPKLFPDVLGDVITPTRQELFFFAPPTSNDHFHSPRMPAWIDDTDPKVPYGCPDMEQHGVKIGFHRLGPRFDPDSVDRPVREAATAEIREYVATRFPALAEAPLIASRVCQYENTHRGDFLIDRHPEFPHIWFLGGGSGHGFKHGPAVANYIVGRLEGRIAEEPAFALEANATPACRSVI
jgi:sarcosine oxidase